MAILSTKRARKMKC